MLLNQNGHSWNFGVFVLHVYVTTQASKVLCRLCEFLLNVRRKNPRDVTLFNGSGVKTHQTEVHSLPLQFSSAVLRSVWGIKSRSSAKVSTVSVIYF